MENTPFEKYPLLAARIFGKQGSFFSGMEDAQDKLMEASAVLASKARDSGVLAQSNFAIAVERLEAVEPQNPFDSGTPGGWTVESFGHWAAGWVEYLFVRPDASDAVKGEAEAMLKEMEKYPVLDEEDLSERENEALRELWNSLTPRERYEAAGNGRGLNGEKLLVRHFRYAWRNAPEEARDSFRDRNSQY